MILVSIGIVVGLIMGLTGAGGALIAIPLFIDFLQVTIKEATILSLTVVILGSIINILTNKNRPSIKEVLIFSIAGSLANYATIPLKNHLPDIAIAILLTAIAVFSIKNVWAKESNELASTKSPGTFSSIIIGALLGLTTTLTGLGGGVLIIPVLRKFYGKSYEEALPTSLLTIFFLAGTSLMFQLKTSGLPIDLQGLVLVTVGVTVSALALRMVITKMGKEKADKIRKITFSLVTIYSMVSVMKAVI